MGRQPGLADETFLPELTLDEIREMYDAEEDKRDAQKLLVAYHYKAGKPIKEAAGAACTGHMNAWRWTEDMYRRGPDALSHRQAPGAARWLTRDEYIRMVIDVCRGPRACGFKADAWSYVLIHKHVCKKYKVKIGYRALVHNLHELRIVIKAPKTPHPGEASRKGRAELRRETGPPGRIRLPAACEPKGGREAALTPEMRDRLPPRLANSGLPDAYLADPPEILLKGWKK